MSKERDTRCEISIRGGVRKWKVDERTASYLFLVGWLTEVKSVRGTTSRRFVPRANFTSVNQPTRNDSTRRCSGRLPFLRTAPVEESLQLPDLVGRVEHAPDISGERPRLLRRAGCRIKLRVQSARPQLEQIQLHRLQHE